MALGRGGSKITTGVSLTLFVLAGLAGTCASLYAMVIAYLAGSNAQAAIDGCPPADPMNLARASMAELSQTVESAQGGVINVDSNDVEVNNVETPALDEQDERSC